MREGEKLSKRTVPFDTVSGLAGKVISLARDAIAVRFRFFDSSLVAIELVEEEGLGGYVSDAGRLRYDPARLIRDYADDVNFAVRLLLHVIFHNLFMHHLRKDAANRQYWDIACDIAVENAIISMESGYTRLSDTNKQTVLAKLNKWVPYLSAESIYREFMVGGISSDSATEYAKLFGMDIHLSDDTPKDEITISAKDWERISRRVAAQLKSFSKDVKGAETILINLKEGVRKKTDYEDILRRFAIPREEIKVSPDEFDYIYYMYGLSLYEDMPLIEPLEYTDEKKIKDFVIAIDTSASVRGKMVESFLKRTYDILSTSVSFSESMNVHVIQCDSEVTTDTVITDRTTLSKVAENMKVGGFGATDFRPVFEYVGKMQEKREFTDLKGLIYFTDGYGIYPENPPGYDCMFVFDRADEFRPPVPGWAAEVIL